MWSYPKIDLGNTSLQKNVMLKTLNYLLFIPAIFYLFFWLPHIRLSVIVEEIREPSSLIVIP